MSTFQNGMKGRDRAINTMETAANDAYATECFNKPDPKTGMSDHDMVKAGRATTKDMSRWV